MRSKTPFPKYKIVFNWVMQGIASVIMKIFFVIFFRVQVKGLEHVKAINYGPVIYAANHYSDFDSVLIRTALPLFNTTTTLFAVCRTKKEYQWTGWKRIVYGDWFFRMLGAYPAIKGTGDYGKSLKTLVDIANSGQTILIFTGGKQNNPDEPVKNRGGTSYLSWASGLPVVPVAVCGTGGLSLRKIFFSQPLMTIQFGKPISKEKLFANQNLTNPDFSVASKVVTNEIDAMRNLIRGPLSEFSPQHST